MTYNITSVNSLNSIYSKQYYHFFPREQITFYFRINSSTTYKIYTLQERSFLASDINLYYKYIIRSHPLQKKCAVFTVGPSCVGKEKLLLTHFTYLKKEGRKYVYLSTKESLKHLSLTYRTECNIDPLSIQEIRAKWVPGAKTCSHVILANLIRKNYAFCFKASGLIPETQHRFHFLTERGYKIELLHITVPDAVRLESAAIKKKDLTPNKAHAQGLQFAERLYDTYFAYAHKINFYYRGNAKEEAQLTAIWTRNRTTPGGNLTIVSPSLYEQIKATQNIAARALGRDDLLWEKVVEENSNTINNSNL